MNQRILTSLLGGWLIFGMASEASALQPLASFVKAAEKTHPDVIEAQAVVEQRRAEESIADWRLLPSFSASATYTRNQYERGAVFNPAVGTEYFLQTNQFDAALVLSVPIVNVAAWDQKSASDAMSQLAVAQSESTRIGLQKQVVRAYYQLLADAALRRAAVANLELSKQNTKVVQNRSDDGAATRLDLERAKADVARAEHDVSAAGLRETLARRSLFSLTGIEPDAIEKFPSDDLRAEAPLDGWIRAAGGTPMLKAARAARKATDKQADAARAIWYPTLTGVAQERFSNATALVGHEAYYQLQLTLGWHLDGTTLYQSKAANAQSNAAAARELQTKKELNDAVFQAWHQVQTGIEQARSARERVRAAQSATSIAQEQYQEGMITQLDVLAAHQAAFAAEVGRINADADLAYARASLRVLTDRPLGAQHP